MPRLSSQHKPFSLRHVARLRRLGATKNFGRRAIVTGKRTRLTVAITVGTTVLSVGFWLGLTFWSTLVTNEVKKLSNKLLGREGSLGWPVPPCPFLATCLFNIHA